MLLSSFIIILTFLHLPGAQSGGTKVGCVRNKCYYYYNDKIDWIWAKGTCHQDGGTLGIVDNDNVRYLMRDFLRRHGFHDTASGVWLGGHELYTSAWYWIDQDQLPREFISDANLQWGTSGYDGCVALQTGSYYHIVESNCATKMYFICLEENGDFRLGEDSKKSWFEAREECVKWQADLAMPKRKDDIRTLVDWASFTDVYWIGIFRSRWTWGNGQSMTYFSWNPSRPSNKLNNCLEMTANGNWNDGNCSVNKPFICERVVRSSIAPSGASPTHSIKRHTPTTQSPGTTSKEHPNSSRIPQTPETTIGGALAVKETAPLLSQVTVIAIAVGAVACFLVIFVIILLVVLLKKRRNDKGDSRNEQEAGSPTEQFYGNDGNDRVKMDDDVMSNTYDELNIPHYEASNDRKNSEEVPPYAVFPVRHDGTSLPSSHHNSISRSKSNPAVLVDGGDYAKIDESARVDSSGSRNLRAPLPEIPQPEVTEQSRYSAPVSAHPSGQLSVPTGGGTVIMRERFKDELDGIIRERVASGDVYAVPMKLKSKYRNSAPITF